MPNIAVSIIIVNFNTKKLLQDCLDSIFAQTHDISFEVLVSDNGSTDGSCAMLRERYPQVTVLDNGANLGFGAANNRALARAQGDFVLYLNSDTLLLNNAVKLFYDYWQLHGEADALGAIGCNLLDGQDRVIHSAGDFPRMAWELRQNAHDLLRVIKHSIPLLRRHHLGVPDDGTRPRVEGDVDYVTGADLFVRRDSYARFDERYFLYYEDTDLQKSLAMAGKRRRIIAGPRIAHLKGQSGTSGSVLGFYGSMSKIQTQLSACLFQKKFFYAPVRLFLLKLLITLIWIHPSIIKKSRPFIPRLWRI